MLEWIKKLFNIARRPVCFHDYKTESMKLSGKATLSWAATATRQYDCVEKCAKCGKTRSFDGVLWCDKKLHPEFYNERGWPIDEQGNELPI